ncbi:50S ribosomal protein L11 methyltransferase [Rubrolithibacter danxiaensis]|uniref:50S ribosomal protein L11 methyltransferase n=1 Tax=Rubrolithibacter danxiaensis TaxID=3390805 RepID=UPI003BF7B7C9
MIYLEYSFILSSAEEYQKDILIDALAGAGFDSFEESESGFKAYVAENEFKKDLFEQLVADLKTAFDFQYDIKCIEQQNWNQVWESNFSPITISDTCYIRATFHEPRPEFPFEIVIDPKMAFGTGHHQTTAMMLQFMLEENFENKAVLDMGCGTGILAILADKIKAEEVVAIDYDPVCTASTQENAVLNNASRINVICGSKEVVPAQIFDVVLANINRNILLDQFETYSEVLQNNGILFTSGFYEADLPLLIEKARQNKLEFNSKKKSGEWIAAKFIKRK